MSNKNVLTWLLFVCSAVAVLGCGSDAQSVTQVRLAETGIPNSGFVPYPILVEEVEPGVLEPVLGPDGSYLPAWDGSLADLMAADAYADCAESSTMRRKGHAELPDLPGSLPGNDQYFVHLRSKMDAFVCEPSTDTFDPWPAYWIRNRTSSRCNVDPQTGKLTHIEVSTREFNQYKSFHEFLYPDDWENFTENPNLFADSLYAAGHEVEYADLNLCIAQRLRAQLNGGQSLFTPTRDHAEILELIQERAELAVIYYGLLAKVFSSTEPAPSTVVAEDYDFLVLIRYWAEQADPSILGAIGRDFATAVRLHLHATQELATVLVRQAATRRANGVGFSRADRDWGIGQPRIRLMNLLYGGDPMGTPEFPHPPGRWRGGVGRNGTLPAYVSAAMSDPRIGTLLGLARASDLLLMKVATDEFGEPIGFDVAASAQRLYRKLEVALRAQACELETPGDPSCDPQVVEAGLPPTTELGDYVLWQEHRIETTHAGLLAQAFDEAFGQLVQQSASSNELYRSRDGVLHLVGAHTTEVLDDDPWIHVDPNFATLPFAGHELMVDHAPLVFLPKKIVFDADARQQGFIYSGASSRSLAEEWEKLRGLGAVAALAFAREALVEGSEAPAFAQSFFDQAGMVLPDIERATGRRSVIMRPARVTSSGSCQFGFVWPAGSTCKTFIQDTSANQLKHEVDVTTHPEDPLDRLTLATSAAQVHTLALDQDSVGFDGSDRATLDGYPVVTATTHSYSGYASGYERRTFAYMAEATPLLDVLLRGNDPDGSQGEQVYMSLFGHLIQSDEAYFTSFGGALNAIGQRATSVLPYDWSRPAFDAFGFPVDWVPPADASLIGGAAGEPSYQYYLRSAKEAAQEATAAVQKAIDTLVEETLLNVELEAAEERASTISEIEMQALCGSSETCELPLASWRPTVPDDCASVPSGTAQVLCGSARQLIEETLGEVEIAEDVMANIQGVTPTFQDLAGSEFQRNLIRQWNAVQRLQRVVNGAADLGVGIALEVDAAMATRASASAETAAAWADIDAAFAELDTTDAETLALIGEMQARQDELEVTVDHAEMVADRECDDDDALADAVKAGQSFANATKIERRGASWSVEYAEEGRSWSPGPFYAQLSRCLDAAGNFNRLNQAAQPTKAALNEHIDALLQRVASLTPLQRTALSKRRIATLGKYRAAATAARAAQHSAWSQMSAALLQVQEAQGELLTAVAELDQIQLRAENAVASANLDRDLVENQADVRFGLQRKFRSYDMWRARALLEGARRMAVAARRAIEARFVVDLSNLHASQAFVESPAVWADEVYATDLDAPAVVGLTVAPTLEDAVYPNQLLDYVGNLERFVQGYTVTYPTSIASPDTEVIVLPGPENTEVLQTVTEGVDQVIVEEIEALAGESLGWTFLCPGQSIWMPHPGTGQVPLENRLEAMCDGAPPSRMRYNFSLDPWARLNRSIGSDPLEQRHNVRWRQLAVNLVGTGIRDCQGAEDPQRCFSEAFLRFQLVHSGPAWATNHAQQWRAFDLPAAFIESGKALASEEWLDPIANNWNSPFVSSVARGELFGRPVQGGYELTIEVSPDVRLERIDRVQLLVGTDYWVRQQ